MRRALSALAVAAVAATLAAGCASAAASSALRLQDIKSPVQLLRNQAASRMDPAIVQSTQHPSDATLTCRDTSKDPQHLWLTWKSTVTLQLTYAASADMAAVQQALVDTFIEQGWKAKDGDSYSAIDLTRASSIATISVYTTNRTASPRTGGTLEIDVTGPCVKTPGAASAEVKQLLEQSQADE